MIQGLCNSTPEHVKKPRIEQANRNVFPLQIVMVELVDSLAPKRPPLIAQEPKIHAVRG
jgi:hypothetical protein